MPTVPTLQTIEEHLAWNFWNAFREAFIENQEVVERIMQAADEGQSEVCMDRTFNDSELAWVQAYEELKDYLELTGEPFDALGYHFRLDLNGEVEMTLATEFEPKRPRKTHWQHAAERYLAKHPERLGEHPFQVP